MTTKLVLTAMLLLCSGFFACAEASLFSLTHLHLHKMAAERSPFIAFVRRLVSNPRKLLITILVGNESVNIGISILATSMLVSVLGMDKGWVAIAVTTPVLLIFGEAVPKTLGVLRPIRFASLVSPVLVIFSRILTPLVWVLEGVSGWLLRRVVGIPLLKQQRAVMEEEYRLLVDAGHREGALEASQRDMIHRVFELGDKPVAEIMVPRVDMFCLPLSLDYGELEREIIRARHAMVPIYGHDRDDILGILQVKDLLEGTPTGSAPPRLEGLLQKPYFVPLEKTAGSLLWEFQERRMKMAVVVDEYGGVSGLVTLEDILEDLVEDIYVDLDRGRNLYERLDEQTLIVSGRMPLEDFQELTDLSAPEEDFDTVGGFVFHLFGKLPLQGETVSSGGYVFRAEKMGKARILQVRVVKEEGHG